MTETMRTTKTRARYGAWLLLCTVALAACEPAPSQMTEQEATRMKKITQTMTPRCIGRYLIDMPEDLVLNSQFNVVIDEVSIVLKPMTKQAFDARTEKREIELKAERLMGKSDQPVLKEIVPIENGYGRVFDRSRDGGSNVLRKLELHGLRDGYGMILTIDARGCSHLRNCVYILSFGYKTWIAECSPMTSGHA